MGFWFATLAALASLGQETGIMVEGGLLSRLSVALAYDDYAPAGCLSQDDPDWTSRQLPASCIANLHCRSTGKAKATCFFMVDLKQCEGRFFLRTANGLAMWEVERRGGAAMRPRIRCGK